MELPIDRIVIRERTRKTMTNIAALADSIRETGGPLHPPVVRRDGHDFVLVAGARRLAAMRQLGYDRVAVTVAHSLVDGRSALLAEGEEHTQREPVTPSEAGAHAARIEAVEAALAKERQRTLNNRPACEDSAQATDSASAGRTRDRVAKAVGMSHPKLREAREVIAAAEDETLPEPVRKVAQEAVERMDATGNVHGAHKLVEKAKQDNTPVTQALNALIDSTLPDGWPLIDRAEKGVLAIIRGLLSIDAAALSAVIDDSNRTSIEDAYQSFTRWITAFRQAAPARDGLRLVGGK